MKFLCQEDVYLLELVRYIHLNPLRAKQVEDMNSLDNYLSFPPHVAFDVAGLAT